MGRLCFLKVNAWVGMHWWRPIKLATSQLRAIVNACPPMHYVTKHRQPMFNYYYTMISPPFSVPIYHKCVRIGPQMRWSGGLHLWWLAMVAFQTIYCTDMMKIYVWFIHFDAKMFLTVKGLQLETMFNNITDLGGESARGNSHNKWLSQLESSRWPGQHVPCVNSNKPRALDPQNTARYYNTACHCVISSCQHPTLLIIIIIHNY